MILPAVNVNGIHLSSQQHEALVSIWRTGRMPEPHAGQKPWLWIQALRRRGLVSDKCAQTDRQVTPYRPTPPGQESSPIPKHCRQSTLRSLLGRLLQQPVNLPISARFGNHLQKEL